MPTRHRSSSRDERHRARSSREDRHRRRSSREDRPSYRHSSRSRRGVQHSSMRRRDGSRGGESSYSSRRRGGDTRNDFRHDRRNYNDRRGGQDRDRFISHEKHPLCVLFMGLPGSGKSTYKNTHYKIGLSASSKTPKKKPDLKLLSGDAEAFVDVSPDLIKKDHRDFGLPRFESDVHSWSVIRSCGVLKEYARFGVNLILDCSGTNVRWMDDRIQDVKRFGYRIHLVFVDTPAAICLYRNRMRGLGVSPADLALRDAYRLKKTSTTNEQAGTNEITAANLAKLPAPCSASSANESKSARKRGRTADQSAPPSPRSRQRRKLSQGRGCAVPSSVAPPSRGVAAVEHTRTAVECAADQQQERPQDHREEREDHSKKSVVERSRSRGDQQEEDSSRDGGEYSDGENASDAWSHDADEFGAREIPFDKGHFVPEEVLLEKVDQIHPAFEELRKHEDVEHVVRVKFGELVEGGRIGEEQKGKSQNILEKNASVTSPSAGAGSAKVDKNTAPENFTLKFDPPEIELRKAQLDLYLYPAPRTEGVPPTDVFYGVPPNGSAGPDLAPGSRRTMRMAHWKRDPRVARAKKTRLAWMDSEQPSREEVIFSSILTPGIEKKIEKNMFPYQMPDGCEHWTLWARDELTHDLICDFVEKWISDQNRDETITCWNYDDNNARRTIDIPHVHVYFTNRGFHADWLPDARYVLRDVVESGVPLAGAGVQPAAVDNSSPSGLAGTGEASSSLGAAASSLMKPEIGVLAAAAAAADNSCGTTLGAEQTDSSSKRGLLETGAASSKPVLFFQKNKFEPVLLSEISKHPDFVSPCSARDFELLARGPRKKNGGSSGGSSSSGMQSWRVKVQSLDERRKVLSSRGGEE